jgi:hypothetical protein
VTLNLQAHCQSLTSQRKGQSFVKELAKQTQDKIVFKKIHSPSIKIKTQRITKHKQTMKLKPITNNGLQGRKTEHQLPTAVLQKRGCSASVDSLFV